VLNLQLIWPARIVRGITATHVFLDTALKGMSLKDLLAAAELAGLEFSVWHSVDSNILRDLQCCHCNF